MPLLARIASLSALILFLEMLLIRWVGTELRVFAYVPNGVLVAVFLGLGLGCRSARSSVRLFPALLAMLVLTFVVRDPFEWQIGEGVTQGLVAFRDSIIWYQGGFQGASPFVHTALVYFAFSVTVLLLAVIAYAFRPLGQWLGRWMDAHPRPIAAYSANIVGSLLGIAGFVGLTAAGTPPIVWFTIAGVGLALLAPLSEEPRPWRVAAIGVALALPLLVVDRSGAEVFWSPYQKLALSPLQVVSARTGAVVTCGEHLSVNNVVYQSLLDLDIAGKPTAPKDFSADEILVSQHVLPHHLVGPRARVLIVGAGAGNDAAAALRASAEDVRAVEIDPTIVEIGRRRHPNRPYDSPRVHVTVDDARAFFRKDRGTYDLVWFGLLDAHTALSAYTNVRLDHYVYTRESFADAKARLAPSGVIVLLFAVHEPWIAERLAGLLQATFGTPPLAFSPSAGDSPCVGYGGTLLIGGSAEALAPVRARALADPRIRPLVAAVAFDPRRTRLTTDDWPYLYLERPSVPRFHMLVGMACLGLGVVLRRALFKPGESLHLPMLLLGAAFMLFEVTGVSRAALLFGTTWTVNAYVVAAILAMILLANLAASRWTVPYTGWPVAGLLIALLGQIAIPATAFASLSQWLRVLLGGGFLALPVFFSGLVFVAAWAAAERKDLALGSNLLGSLIGGVASMLSMAVGFQALLWLTLATYLAAILLLGRQRSVASRSA